MNVQLAPGFVVQQPQEVALTPDPYPNPNPNPNPNPDPNPNPNPDPDPDPDPSQGGALHAFDRAFGYVFAGLMLADFAQRTMRTPLLKVHHASSLALTL